MIRRRPLLGGLVAVLAALRATTQPLEHRAVRPRVSLAADRVIRLTLTFAQAAVAAALSRLVLMGPVMSAAKAATANSRPSQALQHDTQPEAAATARLKARAAWAAGALQAIRRKTMERSTPAAAAAHSAAVAALAWQGLVMAAPASSY